ncbi:MAG TPA: hypothetical protein PLI17_14870, partial [Denitromonas sp.]|nr:hypothetical protein [Denitromonas sp.]
MVVYHEAWELVHPGLWTDAGARLAGRIVWCEKVAAIAIGEIGADTVGQVVEYGFGQLYERDIDDQNAKDLAIRCDDRCGRLHKSGRERFVRNPEVFEAYSGEQYVARCKRCRIFQESDVAVVRVIFGRQDNNGAAVALNTNELLKVSVAREQADFQIVGVAFGIARNDLFQTLAPVCNAAGRYGVDALVVERPGDARYRRQAGQECDAAANV